MSFEFSRRSFLKYTAVAAVAVAGSSLLTGCDNDNTSVLKKYGTITNLQAKATLSKATYDATAGTIVFDFEVYCGRGNDMNVSNQNFDVEITDADGNTVYKSAGTKIKISDDLYHFNLENKATATGTVTASGVPALSTGYTVKFKYQPDTTYTTYVSEWDLDYSLLDTGNN